MPGCTGIHVQRIMARFSLTLSEARDPLESALHVHRHPHRRHRLGYIPSPEMQDQAARSSRAFIASLAPAWLLAEQ